jgi:hypothetical protein
MFSHSYVFCLFPSIRLAPVRSPSPIEAFWNINMKATFAFVFAAFAWYVGHKGAEYYPTHICISFLSMVLQCTSSPLPLPMDAKQALAGHSKIMKEGSALVHQVGEDHIKAMDGAIFLGENNRPIYHQKQHRQNIYDNTEYYKYASKLKKDYDHKLPGMLEHVKNHHQALQGTNHHEKIGEAAILHQALEKANQWTNHLPEEANVENAMRRMGTGGRTPAPNPERTRTTQELRAYRDSVQQALNSLPKSKGKKILGLF